MTTFYKVCVAEWPHSTPAEAAETRDYLRTWRCEGAGMRDYWIGDQILADETTVAEYSQPPQPGSTPPVGCTVVYVPAALLTILPDPFYAQEWAVAEEGAFYRNSQTGAIMVCVLVIEKECGRVSGRYALFAPLRSDDPRPLPFGRAPEEDSAELIPYRVLFETSVLVGKSLNSDYIFLTPHRPTFSERVQGIQIQMQRDAQSIASMLLFSRSWPVEAEVVQPTGFVF